ncbi:short transient receptor potential channel 4-like [Adelges cooleyi]|uniref:short transient receptor potential channel 4-like n=1 Tax=Adelges cooleyi TaxID=133065 RepID=UPI0021808BD8|nr:short transient receptor potential channel 4-like [Adelges cooleyi]
MNKKEKYTKKSKVRMASRRHSLIEELSDKAEQFFDIVERCDLSAAEDFLSENKVDINMKDFQGLTPLHLAIRNDCYPLVDLFLRQQGIKVGDSKLFAIAHDNLAMLKHLFDYEETLFGTKEQQKAEQSDPDDSEEYPSFMTPLLLAAQCGRYEIIEYLLASGHRLERPHPPRCMCTVRCLPMLESADVVANGCERLNLFRAISNPAYLCCTSHDPILACFQLHDELLECGAVEQVYKTVYTEMAYKVRQFAVEMIVNCRTSDEVKIILKNPEGCKFKGTFIYPRLITAMDYKQKEFVAHTNIQQVLESAWIGDWIEWKAHSSVIKCAYPLWRLMKMPLTVVFGLLSKSTDRSCRLPIDRMFDSLIMYTVFLMLLFYQSNMDKFEMRRGAPESGAELIIFLFVLGYILENLRLRNLQGPDRYFKNLWNIYDTVKLLLFALSMTCWVMAAIQAKWADPDLDRKYWHWADPQLLGEALFAFATVMSFVRLLFLCQLNYYIGPMQVSLGKVLNDFAKFMTFLVIIMMAFTSGLGTFYSYYAGMSQKDPESEQVTTQEDSFISIPDTFKTLFWGIFCMTPLEAPNVVIGNDGNIDVQHHYFTQFVGYMLFALFEVLMVIVMLNMLIAAMSDTFQRVVDNADYEWLFGRTEVYVNYMLMDKLPSPFNLLSFTFLGFLIGWLPFRLCKKFEKRPKTVDVQEERHKSDMEYQKLIKELIKRYLMQQAQLSNRT